MPPLSKVVDPNSPRARARAFLRGKKFVKWAPVTVVVIQQQVERQAKEERRQKVFRKEDYTEQESFKRLNNSGRLKLESMEGAFRYLFEVSGLRLGEMQDKLIKVIMVAFLRKMFGPELVANLKYLKKKFMFTDLNDTIAILFPV